MSLRGGMPYESARSTPRPRRMCILQEKVRLRVKPPAAPHPGHVTASVRSVSPAGCSVIGRAKKNILNHKRTPSEIRSYTKAAPWRHLCLFEESSYGTVKTTEWTCWLGADCFKIPLQTFVTKLRWHYSHTVALICLSTHTHIRFKTESFLYNIFRFTLLYVFVSY